MITGPCTVTIEPPPQSPHAAPTEACVLSLCSQQQKLPQWEAPLQREQTNHSPQLEKSHAATKVQHSQTNNNNLKIKLKNILKVKYIQIWLYWIRISEWKHLLLLDKFKIWKSDFTCMTRKRYETFNINKKSRKWTVNNRGINDQKKKNVQPL